MVDWVYSVAVFYSTVYLHILLSRSSKLASKRVTSPNSEYITLKRHIFAERYIQFSGRLSKGVLNDRKIKAMPILRR